MTETETSEPKPHLREENLRDRMIERISGDSAALAALRRGLGMPPGESPECWPWTVPLSADHGQAWETAIHHTLTLYALHQQSRSESMHRRDNTTLGQACRILQSRRMDSQGVERRFLAAATSDTVDELANHLRGLVILLRGEGVALDYDRLFWDLLGWETPTEAGRTRRRWGRDFYRIDPDRESQETSGAASQASPIDQQTAD